MSAAIQGELWSSDPRGWAEAAEGRIRPLYERVLERIPFGDGAFDVVTAFNSVLYAADPRRALAEIARATAPLLSRGAGAMTDEFGALVRSYRAVINPTRREPQP